MHISSVPCVSQKKAPQHSKLLINVGQKMLRHSFYPHFSSFLSLGSSLLCRQCALESGPGTGHWSLPSLYEMTPKVWWPLRGQGKQQPGPLQWPGATWSKLWSWTQHSRVWTRVDLGNGLWNLRALPVLLFEVPGSTWYYWKNFGGWKYFHKTFNLWLVQQLWSATFN